MNHIHKSIDKNRTKMRWELGFKLKNYIADWEFGGIVKNMWYKWLTWASNDHCSSSLIVGFNSDDEEDDDGGGSIPVVWYQSPVIDFVWPCVVSSVVA